MTSLNHDNNLCLVTLPSPSASADAAKVQSKLEALKEVNELCDFHEKFKNGENPSKNLLDNLCDGLETFLGFNKESKGYDGQGIVYSDLDRLCDGVMGFLSGVLGEVKDDDAVKTYNNYMPVNDRLENVLDTLTTNIGTGRAGLAVSVDAVKGWLNNYLLELGKRTSRVTGNLGRLNDDISNKISCFADVSDQKLETQLEEWKSTIISLDLDLKTIENTYINKLDRSIRNSIIHEMRVIHSTVSVLRQAATDVAFGEQIKKCDIELEIQRAHIVSRINNESERVRKSVEAQVNRIGNEINHMEMTKKWHIDDINRTLKDSLASAGQIDGTYESLLTWHFDEIKKVVNDAQNTLFEKKAALEVLVATTRRYFEELKQHLGNYKQDKKGDDLNSKWMQLTTKILQEVSNLYCEQRTADKLNYIGMIEHGLQSFTKDFGTQAFETAILTKWVTEIVKDRYGKVYREIGNYVSERSAARIDRNNVESAIINNLPVYLKRYVTTAIQAVVGAASSSTLDAKLSLIASKLGEFAEKCQNELQTDETLIEAAASIEGEGGLNIINQGVSHKNHFLKQSIKHILYSLSVSAKNFASEFQSFLSTSNIGTNLRGAISTIKLIGQQFEESINSSFGEKIDAALNGISQRIDDLDGMLKTNTSMLPAAVKALDSVIAEMDGIKNNDSSGKIEEQKEKAGNVLLHMKTDIVDKLNGIVLAVQDADTGFSTAVQTIRSTLAEGYATAAKSVSALKSSLLEQVKTSFATLTKDVQTLFATRHKSDLEALRKLIETQTLQIHNIIETDQNNGIKGLIRKMLDNFTYRLDDFSSWHSNGKTLKFTKLAHFAAKSTEAFEHSFHHLKQQRELSSNFSKAEPSTTALFDLLDRVIRSQHYDNLVSNKYEDLQNALSKFPADTLPDAPKSLLAPLKAGLSAFAAQLGHAYVNRYSGQRFEGDLITQSTTKKSADTQKPDSTPDYDLTPEGRNCAKVCLTIVEMVVDGLAHLEMKCKDASKYGWKSKTICEKIENKENPLGTFLDKCGFRVPTNDGRKQDGELQWEADFTGKNIFERIDHTIHISKHEHVPQCRLPEKEWNFNVIDFIKCFYTHIKEYNQVGHLAALSSKRHPCSVFEMLCWLNGLTHHPVYLDLTTDGFNHLLDKPKRSGNVVPEDLPLEDFSRLSIEAYPNDITYTSIHDAITHITLYSHDLLTTVVGFGDEATQYACDYANNSMRLHYPAGPSECFEMLVSVLRRLLPVLRFVEIQCQLSSRQYGWADCEYGKNVPTTKSLCNEQPSGKPKCQPTCEANSKPTCQPTSPLMCYLSDSLIGCLPHQVESIGCKSECKTCVTGKRGMPCLTPLGFRAFSGSTKTGKDLCQAIVAFFGDANLSSLLCLTATPPATLPEHFGFALSLERGLSAPRAKNSKLFVSVAEAIEASITSQSIALYDTPSRLTTPICNAYGSTQNGRPNREPKCADLSSLSTTTTDAAQTAYTAPYLHSLCHDYHYYLPNKHADSYLSWAIYLPWALHKYLEGLRDALKNIFCYDWGCITCLHGDKCKRGEHGIIDGSCKCASVVSCRGVLPTLYKYGFVFQDARNLISSKKTCFNFKQQLDNVLNSQYFKNLFNECDKFLFKIRAPFIWLNVALWLLSLLYLLHIMVIRLDLLHIKSHLHSPSGHRIAAQSLLAAARVDKHNRVFYLQP